MKKFLFALMAAAAIFAGCSEDETTPEQKPDPDPEPPKVEIPSIAVSDAVRNATNDKVSVTVTPSEDAEAWYWMLSADGAAAEYTEEKGGKSLEFDLVPDVTYLLTVYAENSAGKSEEVTCEWGWSRAELQAELVEVSVKNVSPYSMDVEVLVNSRCAQYVIMSMPTSTLVAGKDLESRPYTDEEIDAVIAENARMSLDPETNGGIQPYNVSDADATFTERTLTKSGLRMNPETEYMVAVYAVDDEGGAKIYRQNTTTPKAEVNGSAEIELVASEVGADFFTLKATGDGNVSRVIMGYMHENDALDQTGTTFKDIPENERAAKLVSLAAELPLEYTGEPLYRRVESLIQPLNTYVGYAIAIDKEGRLGKVVYNDKITTTDVVLDGVGSITAVTIGEQEETGLYNGDMAICILPISIEVRDAVAVRLYSGPESDYGIVEPSLNRGMIDKALGVYTEYSLEQLARIEIPIEIAGSDYAIVGSTVDADGKVSPVQNLVSIATDGQMEFYPTVEIKKEVETGDIFGGTGELEYCNITDLSPATEMDMGTFIYEIKRGANTTDVYWIPSVGIMTNAEIKEEVAAKFEGFPATEPNKNYKVNLNETTGIGSKRVYFDENYPHAASTTYFVVTVDTNNKIRIVYTYNSGEAAPVEYVEE